VRFVLVPLIISLLVFCPLAANDNLSLKSPQRTGGVDFYKEEITLVVKDCRATISGEYYFCNNSNKEGVFPISFPFFIDSLTSYPDKIKAYGIEKGKTIKLKLNKDKKSGSITIQIPLKSKATTIWHLNYSQKIQSTHARYIITSTNAWRLPLLEATYRFIAPVDFDSIRVWPEADSTFKESTRQVFIAHKRDFMPHQDMEIFWHQK
jgi:hypothetical protein